MIFVFDFGLGEGGAVVDAPVDRLESFVNVALVEEVNKGARDDGLIGRLHREVGIVPAAKDAEAFEILALQVDPFFGVLAADAAHLRRGHLGFL